MEQTAANQKRSDFRWSFSQWETYDTCPARWHFASVIKLPRGMPGPAASRGRDVHAAVESYIGGSITALPDPIRPAYVPVIDAYKHHPNGDRWVEKRITLDVDWTLTAVGTRGVVTILDAVRVLNGVPLVAEWKTGKPKERHTDQRKLYAMAAMRAWMADRVEVTTYYLEDTAPPQKLVLEGEAGFQKLVDLWQPRVELMQRDQLCAPKPGLHCRWCDYAKAKGGPCQFGA